MPFLRSGPLAPSPLVWTAPGHWEEVSKRNPLARRMADRHYSYRGPRDRPHGVEVGPPGQKIILLTPDCKAVWGSHRPAPWVDIERLDGIRAWCCFIFRNEGSGILSSDLIKEAVAVTVRRWGVAPQGFITYIGVDHIQSSNPGFCFLMAGFEHHGWVQSSYLGKLRRLVLSPEQCRELSA